MGIFTNVWLLWRPQPLTQLRCAHLTATGQHGHKHHKTGQQLRQGLRPRHYISLYTELHYVGNPVPQKYGPPPHQKHSAPPTNRPGHPPPTLWFTQKGIIFRNCTFKLNEKKTGSSPPLYCLPALCILNQSALYATLPATPIYWSKNYWKGLCANIGQCCCFFSLFTNMVGKAVAVCDKCN